jgi:hypothetical protein
MGRLVFSVNGQLTLRKARSRPRSTNRPIFYFPTKNEVPPQASKKIAVNRSIWFKMPQL